MTTPINYALAIFIEPTSYILGFIHELERQWDGQLDVIFLKENHTQEWNIQLPSYCVVLATSLFKTVTYLRAQINRKRYSILHLAGWGELACLYILFLAKFKQIPIAIESDAQLIKNSSKWQYKLRQITYQRFFYPLLFKLPDIFLPGGTSQAKYFRHYGVPWEKLVLAQMTIDVQSLQREISLIKPEERVAFRQENSANPSDVVFLYVGRLLYWKGIIELIEAFKNLKMPNIKLWIVGSGELEGFVRELSQETNNIYYFDRESGSRLIQRYYAADVFVLPSAGEPWGLVVNEAMSTENALIVSDNAGCVPDLILHEKTGLLVTARDIQSLTKTMDRLINNPSERIALALQAKEHISTWTLENEAKNVIHAWRRVLS